jgi:PAS domain S-box-containing protein
MQVDLTDVRSALGNDSLVPCFQPIVALHTGQLAGFEILARWRHPQLGLVLPENFVSLADENGLVCLLMRQILHKAFLSASHIPEPLVLAVNISPSQLRDLTLPDQIREAAEKSEFPLKRLTVEITESGLVDNFERAQTTTGKLKALGCSLSLDDFGTEYSSLRYLQALSFDQLKIDRSFVSVMTNTRESRKIVAAIVGLGRSLGMMTVGEGVETEEQAEMLLWLGCEFGQGWFYGRPLTADRIPDVVGAVPRKLATTLSIHGDGWVVSSLEAQPVQRLAQLQAIYDGAPVGLCFLDRNLRYVSLNRRLADMDGNSVVEYMGKTVQQMTPKAFPLFEPYLRRALKGEAILEVEISTQSPRSGEADRTILLSYQPAFDEAEEVIGVSVSAVDITGRKRTEEALRVSEEHLRNIVEHNPEIPWVMDAEGNNLDVSSRWTKLTGLSKEKTRDLGWLDALHPDDVQPTLKALRTGMRTGMPIDIEYRVKSADQSWRWMRSRGSPHLESTGSVACWYGSVEDIQERKQMEDMLRKNLA